LPDASWTEYSRFVAALLAILDPLFAVPIFLGLTRDYAPAERRRTAAVTASAVTAILIGAALVGEWLLVAVGTSLAAFRVGGGLVVLMMAISMLMAQPGAVRQTREEAVASEQKEAIAVVPLGIPLLAGPGAISTVIIEMDRVEGPGPRALVVACIAGVGVVVWLVLRFAGVVDRVLGPIGLNVVVRLFGLLLAAIGVEFVVNGLTQLLPALAG